MKLEEAKKQQNIFKQSLNEISTRRFKSGEQKMTSKSIRLFYKSREAVIKLYNDNSGIVSAKYKAKHGEELTILTPKQILQRLPIALVQVKTGNISENILNKIRQVIYSLYQSKEII